MSETYEKRSYKRSFVKSKPTSSEVEASLQATLSFLNNSFAKAMRTFPSRNNSAGSPLYNFQVEFSYLLDEIQRGPIYIMSKRISEANALIAEVSAYND